MSDTGGKQISVEEFVTATMMQLMRGVSDAGAEAMRMGGLVNPRAFERDGDFDRPGPRLQDTRALTLIEFDLAVTPIPGPNGLSVVVTGGSASISPASAGGSEGPVVSRVKFRIPVRFPFGRGLRKYRSMRAVRTIPSPNDESPVR